MADPIPNKLFIKHI